MADAQRNDVLDGPGLVALWRSAAAWLAANATSINAINVFPVPDGDTGSNMTLTFQAAVEGAADPPATAGDAARLMARGALMGARGNSGVILSQVVRGFAEGLAEVDVASTDDLARAFEQARVAAYASVPRPVEGTILTVIAAASEAAQRSAAGAPGDCVALIRATVAAAREAVARTPELLPVLKEAGVVDAGGQGLLTILEGCLQHISGEGQPVPVPSASARAQIAAAVEHDEGDFYGYCTEILVSGAGLSRDGALEQMTALGRSVLVVGDETLLRVHVHTEDPGAVLQYGTSAGTLLKVKVDNMEEQYQAWLAARATPGTVAPPAIDQAVVAVAPGEGMADILRGLGAAGVVGGGQTNNPSAQEILEGVTGANAADVLILPNNKNIILAASQAANLTDHKIRVIPTRTFPQGVAALMAFDPDRAAAENEEAMTAAIATVTTIEVTRAVRDATVGGVKVEAGRYIAIIDGELALAEDSGEEAVMAGLDKSLGADASVVTIYWGDDASAELATDLADRITGAFPGVEVETARGGQPLYPYIVAVE